MFAHTVPADISILRTDLLNFCVDAGFTKVGEDIVRLRAYQFNTVSASFFLPESGYYLVSQSDVNASIHNQEFDGHRMVIKDPAGSCYIHLIFYTYGRNATRYGQSEPVAYMDGYLSTGMGGTPDSGAGMCKLASWRSLPISFTGIDMYAGTTSEGRIWVHLAVEEKPLIFSHLGFGSIEKSLDFTGGDFISANSWGFLKGTGSDAAPTYCSFCQSGITQESATIVPNGFYCPDLDEDGKGNPDNVYRALNGVKHSVRSDMELGSTSLRARIFTMSNVPGDAVNAGDLSIANLPLPNPWSGTSPLFPIYVYANNSLNSQYRGQAGYFSGVRAANVQNYNPRDEIILGSDIWAAYPLSAKEGVLPYPYHCYNQGLAVLKNG
jgi:hypothetical protein